MSQQQKIEDGQTIYLWGAFLGVGLGLLSAHLYRRAVQENPPDEPKHNPMSLSVGDMVKLGMLLLGLVRGIAELGANKGDKKKKK